MLVALIDIFVINFFSYDLKDHAFILQTPASTTPLMVDTTQLNRKVREKSMESFIVGLGTV
jgi:hypothetical protein